ncbi:MAG: hypothetical protein KC516_01605 [Nanoarchaeota archaeon]|nr:hypothetical protein [Nanoarchaeota archaeon]
MGIFSFFKKKEKFEKDDSDRVLKYQEIEDFLEDKEKSLHNEEKIALEEIDTLVDKLLKDLKEGLRILKSVNINSKKSDDKTKAHSIEGVKKYSENIEYLIEKLDSIKMKSLLETEKEIDEIFKEFDKLSSTNYERGTLLVGKEMASLKNSIKVFSKNLIKTLNQKKELKELILKIKIMFSKIEEINKIDSSIEKLKSKEKGLDKKIESVKKEEKELFEKESVYHKTKEYEEILEAKRNLEFLKKEIVKKMSELKSLIDFKSLSNFFHKYEKEMEILRKYRDDFKKMYEEDMGKKLISLLDESKLNKDKINSLVKEINKEFESLEKNYNKSKEDKTPSFSENLNKLRNSLEDLETIHSKDIRFNEKVVSSRERLLESLKKGLNNFKAEIEE